MSLNPLKSSLTRSFTEMEVEVRSHRAGLVTFVTEAEDDEDVAEGMLAAIVEDERAHSKL